MQIHLNFEYETKSKISVTYEKIQKFSKQIYMNRTFIFLLIRYTMNLDGFHKTIKLFR
jgi:hypothetical protein